MATSVKIEHLDDVRDIYRYSRLPDVGPFKRPFKRILHLLQRKGMAQTIIEEAVTPPGYLTERQAGGLSEEPCRRIHFFAAHFEAFQLAAYTKFYRGYCDLRPEGCIAKAMIADEVIIRPDTYAYLVCRLRERITLEGVELEVTGFPHIEKDGGVVKCSQAAVSLSAQYWNARYPGRFTATNAVEINRVAGHAADLAVDPKERGLSWKELIKFFQQQQIHAHDVHYWGKKEGQIVEEDPSVTIYGFLESGFPVIAIIQNSLEEHHALTIVGHTFDKNIWTAMADPLYFDKPLTALTKGPGGGSYHSNLAWIKYFIVQDDNMGPYYFLPREILPKIIKGIIAVHPFEEKIRVEPKEAERAAFLGLKHLSETELWKDPRLSETNQMWLDILLDHLGEDPGDGWVLRSMLKSGAEIVKDYRDDEHHGAERIAEQFQNCEAAPFWRVEISWPHLFCYQNMQAGEIVLDAVTADIAFIRVPGILLFPPMGEKKMEILFSDEEEGPYPHAQPARTAHLRT